MLRKLLVTSLLTLGSTLTLLNPANAQSTDPFNDFIRGVNGEIDKMNIIIDNEIEPQVRVNQRELDQLSQACTNGNANACQKWNRRMDRINIRLDQSIQESRNRMYNRTY